MSDVATRGDRRSSRRPGASQPSTPQTPHHPHPHPHAQHTTPRSHSQRTTPRHSPGKHTRRPSHPSAGASSSDDRTDLDLLMLDDQGFAREVERRLGVGRASVREEEAMEEVLLPRPKNKDEEDALHVRVMDLLRERVLALEHEEDPEFDPLCPVEEDLAGLADDPLHRLSVVAVQQTVVPRGEIRIPERL